MAAGIALVMSMSGCTKADFFSPGYDGKYDAAYGEMSGSPSAGDVIGGGGNGGGNGAASGVVTAGEWNDIANWSFWAKLLNNQDWAGYASFWKFYPRNFVYVELTDAKGNPACGVSITLNKEGQKVWEAVSDNTGHAALWANMTEDSFRIDGNGYTLKFDGQTVEDLQFTTPSSSELAVNKYTVGAVAVKDAIEDRKSVV